LPYIADHATFEKQMGLTLVLVGLSILFCSHLSFKPTKYPAGVGVGSATFFAIWTS